MAPISVLVVEDEPITLMDEVSTLQELGYTLAGSAFSGEVALDLAEKTRPDVVLMDIVLSTNMSGVTAAEEIYRRFGIPCVFVTALGNQAEMDSAKDRSPDWFRYIVKPFDKDRLAAAIESLTAA